MVSSFRNAEEISFPTSLTTIADNEFRAFRQLRAIDLENTSVRSIGQFAFLYCSSVETITFPATLQTIGQLAFRISDSAASEFPAAGKGVTELDFSQTQLTVIQGNTFEGHTRLKKVNLDNGRLTQIRIEAFFNCFGVEELIFPATLETIGYQAFSSTNAQMFPDTGLGTIQKTMPVLDLSMTQLTTIGDSVFSNNTIEKIILPVGLKSIEPHAFEVHRNNYLNRAAHSIKTITYPDAPGNGRVGLYEFPDSLEKIGTNAFLRASGVEELNLANTSLTQLSNAFTASFYLKRVSLPEHSRFTEIMPEAFNFARELPDIFIPPNVTKIGNFAVFRGDGRYAYVFGEYGSAAITWAEELAEKMGGVAFLWFYRASPIALSEQPPAIYQYVPFEFTFNTGVPLNRNMYFEIELGADGSTALPDWLSFVSQGLDHSRYTPEYDSNGDEIIIYRPLEDEEITPGTLYGVFTDSEEIAKYNGTPFKITAYPINTEDDNDPHRYKERYSVSVSFTLELEAHPDGDVTTGPFGFNEGGKLGGENGEIIVGYDENGNPIFGSGSGTMNMDAPFNEDDNTWSFEGFYINGERQNEGEDYEAEEGSTIVTIREQTLAGLGEGTHTATATFRRADSDSGVNSVADLEGNAWDVRTTAISQTFTITAVGEEGGGGGSGNGGDNTGGGGSGNGGDGTGGGDNGGTGGSSNGGDNGGGGGGSGTGGGGGSSNGGDNGGGGTGGGSNGTGSTGTGSTGTGTGSTGTGSTGGDGTGSNGSGTGSNDSGSNVTGSTGGDGTGSNGTGSTGGDGTGSGSNDSQNSTPTSSVTNSTQSPTTEAPDTTTDTTHTQPTQATTTDTSPTQNEATPFSTDEYIMDMTPIITMTTTTTTTDTDGNITETVSTKITTAIEPLEIIIDIPYAEFVELYINGELLARDVDYTAVSGSTVISIMPHYLQALPDGEHLINAVFLNEAVTLTFNLVRTNSYDVGEGEAEANEAPDQVPSSAENAENASNTANETTSNNETTPENQGMSSVIETQANKTIILPIILGVVVLLVVVVVVLLVKKRR